MYAAFDATLSCQGLGFDSRRLGVLANISLHPSVFCLRANITSKSLLSSVCLPFIHRQKLNARFPNAPSIVVLINLCCERNELIMQKKQFSAVQKQIWAISSRRYVFHSSTYTRSPTIFGQ